MLNSTSALADDECCSKAVISTVAYQIIFSAQIYSVHLRNLIGVWSFLEELDSRSLISLALVTIRYLGLLTHLILCICNFLSGIGQITASTAPL